MNLVKKLNELSKNSVSGLIKLNSGDIADIEEMAKLIDRNNPNCGYSVKLIKIGDLEPEYQDTTLGISVKAQHGFDSKIILNQTRYYKVEVFLD